MGTQIRSFAFFTHVGEVITFRAYHFVNDVFVGN